jgi:hypothetical protein
MQLLLKYRLFGIKKAENKKGGPRASLFVYRYK